MTNLSRAPDYRVPELDGLRGIAIALVLMWHYLTIPLALLQREGAQMDAGLSWFVRATSATWSGVDLFFVLSGYLIGGLLIDNRKSSNYYKTFYFRRVCRIFPAYFFCMTLFVLLAKLRIDGTEWAYANRVPLWYYATFLQNYPIGLGHSGAKAIGLTWSVAVEEQFYILIPLLIRTVRYSRLPLVLSGLILVGPIARAVIWQIEGIEFGAYVWTVARTDGLIFGVLLAYALRSNGIRSLIREHQKDLWMCFWVAAMALSIALFTGGIQLGGVYTHFFLALFYGCLLVIVVTDPRSRIVGMLGNSFMVWLGTRSYFIYLMHELVRGVWFGISTGSGPKLTTGLDLAITVVALISTFAFAEVSYRRLERPMMTIGRRMKYQFAPVPA